MTGFFPNRMMGGLRQDLLISGLEIAVSGSVFVGLWNPLPQLATTIITTVTDEVSDHLSGATTQGNPNPAFIAFFEDKWYPLNK